MSSAWRYQSVDGFMTDEAYPYTSGTTQTENQCGRKADEVVGKVTGMRGLENLNEVLDAL